MIAKLKKADLEKGLFDAKFYRYSMMQPTKSSILAIDVMQLPVGVLMRLSTLDIVDEDTLDPISVQHHYVPDLNVVRDENNEVCLYNDRCGTTLSELIAQGKVEFIDDEVANEARNYNPDFDDEDEKEDDDNESKDDEEDGDEEKETSVETTEEDDEDDEDEPDLSGPVEEDSRDVDNDDDPQESKDDDDDEDMSLSDMKDRLQDHFNGPSPSRDEDHRSDRPHKNYVGVQNNQPSKPKFHDDRRDKRPRQEHQDERQSKFKKHRDRFDDGTQHGKNNDKHKKFNKNRGNRDSRFDPSSLVDDMF